MLHGDIIQLTQQALWFVLLLSAPPIVISGSVRDRDRGAPTPPTWVS